MSSPYFERLAERATSAAELRDAYDEARREEPTNSELDLACVVDRCGAMVAPADAVDTVEFANATVTTVEGDAWIHSDTVANAQEVR